MVAKVVETVSDLPDIIEFNRSKKYRPIEVLGKGACGVTVKLRDDEIQSDFVAKKFQPFFTKSENPELFSDLSERFRNEARILFKLSHPNIVRVYNFFDYQEIDTAYILMEMIEGENILEFLRQHPGRITEVFKSLIDGFSHLEERQILHRDIRPENILVDQLGIPKIIDFGFGKDIQKQIATPDNQKSISINWWCETPQEFEDKIYDHRTEVYFLGKLFQKAIIDGNLKDFSHKTLVHQMSEFDPQDRPDSFRALRSSLASTQFNEITFSDEDKETYREFAYGLLEVISAKNPNAKFCRDPKVIISGLDQIYNRSILEESVPHPSDIVNVFVSSFHFWRGTEFAVDTLKEFLDLVRSLSGEKQAIVINSVVSKLEAVKTSPPDEHAEVPF